jgi:DNA (cytosine-5)-methyltransferase 1
VEERVNAVDLFAGAGGWSHGWREATGVEPLVAVNHCAHAVHLHRLNHPGTEHFLEDVWSVDPAAAVAGRRVDWLHGSPDCTHFSRAKGGKPREQKIRGLAWVLVDWARASRPRFLSCENVGEFETWGPLDADGQPIKARAGETFGEFVAALRGLGYAVDWRVLCAADFGAPTIRRRLFLVARRDGQPIRWPEPTHGEGRPQPWRTASECIDWSIPCPSIFGRKRPLAPATCRRIAAGIVRFVLQGRPFLVQTGYGERRGQAPRVLDLEQPLGTVVAGGAKHALVAAFLQQNFTGMVGKPLRVPVPTITARDHHSLVTANLAGEKSPQVAAFLCQYYGTGGQHSRVDAPLPAVVTRARHGLVTVEIDGVDYAIADIGLRMLEPRELARAQGFPDSYRLEGTKAEQIARIGNSVVPQVAAAIVRANLGREACVA